jgi:hypothetical protein
MSKKIEKYPIYYQFSKINTSEKKEFEGSIFFHVKDLQNTKIQFEPFNKPISKLINYEIE